MDEGPRPPSSSPLPSVSASDSSTCALLSPRFPFPADPSVFQLADPNPPEMYRRPFSKSSGSQDFAALLRPARCSTAMPQAAVTGSVPMCTALVSTCLGFQSMEWQSNFGRTYCFPFSREWRQQLLRCQQTAQIVLLRIQVNYRSKSHIKRHLHGLPVPLHHDRGTTCLHCRLLSNDWVFWPSIL